ncbi:hypothetical protein [uncultured Tateyamaria sp.]|uniref:hypothetical protein n=1 Tax=uncultured Tateyamaria sp. TaxID=455651 RepID=UPI00263793FD|nr:hypothetical protein [uncultured Tateyamaria sp.]
MRKMWGPLACVGVCVQAAMAWSEAMPMVSRASLMVARAPLIAAPQPNTRASPSLFAGVSGKSLFAPSPRAQPRAALRAPTDGPIDQLRALIAKAEAGPKDYDAVQYGATIRPDDAPTSMTVQQIYDWIDATPGQPHAIGRYQFIPPTLRRLVKRAGIDPSARFTPQVQDQLADILLTDAGLDRFVSGELERHAFMNNLAKIWAGLPNDTGKSHYHGYAGNKASITWAYFDARMEAIFSG